MKIFETQADLALQTLEANQPVATKGKYTANDGEQAGYTILTPAEYNKVPDGDNEFYIANGNIAQLLVGQSRLKNEQYSTWNGTTWVPAITDEVVTTNPDKVNRPYAFKYPADDVEQSEMLRNAGNNSLGYGGSTWWSGPSVIGRKENGVDVVYIGGTYGTPEKPQTNPDIYPVNPDDPADNALYINNRNGEAVTTLTRLELDDTQPTYSTMSFNQSKISYREDEHFQVAVCENIRLGQIIAAFGSRNSARDRITGENLNYVTQIAYGQDSDSLCDTVLMDWSTSDAGEQQMGYSYIFMGGTFGWQISKAADGDWYSATGSGGQFRVPSFNKIFDNVDKNLVSPSNPDVLQTQSYLGLAWVDKWLRADPLDTDYSRLQIFMSNHPNTMTDTSLYHLRGDFIPPDVLAAPYNGGGIYLKRMSDGLPPFGTTGRLNDEPFDKTQMDNVYTPPVGKACRLLDTAYTDTPRALCAVFDKPDSSANSNVPFGTTWDLVYVYWDGATWDSLTIKANIRGFLGYDPNSVTVDDNNNPTGPGREGFVSGYANGASFYKGSDWNDTEANPRIYYCGRDGSDRSKHYLAYQDLNVTWDALSGIEVRLIENSNKILYRPNMALGGDKRILTYNEADGWSSFNSWVAKTRWLDLTV